MNLTQINNINNTLTQIAEKRKNTNIQSSANQKFGNEQYTYEELLSELDLAIQNLKILAEKPENFFRKFNFQERNNIQNILSSISSNIQIPDNLYNHLEQIKSLTRFFPVLSQENLTDLDNQFLALMKKKDELSTNINNFETEKNNIIKRYDDFFKSKEKEYDLCFEKQSQKIEHITKNAESAMTAGEAYGISAAFQAHYNELTGKDMLKGNTFWEKVLRLFIGPRIWNYGTLIFILAAIGIGIWLALDFGEDTATVIGRILLIPIFSTASVFCASQYTKQKNIATDYAYKTALSKSIIAFSRELKNNDPVSKDYQDYVKKILDALGGFFP